MNHKKNSRYKSKKGSVSLFLCIILSGVMLVESVFYYASWIRNVEADLQRCMSLQAYHALANYNEKLFDYYGLYSIQSGYNSSDILEECFPYAGYIDSQITLNANLDTNSLYNGAVSYMKLRLPVMLLSEVTQAFQSASDVIQKSDMQKSMNESKAANPYIEQVLSGKSDLSSVLSSAADVIETFDITGSMEQITSLINTYKMMMEQKATLALQGDMSESDFGDFTNPATLEKMLSMVNGIVDVNLPDTVEKLILNEYIIACFDSQLSNQAAGNGLSAKKGECNFLNTPFSDFHNENQSDLEYIYTGNENHAQSLSTASIYTIRTVISIAEILLDQKEMQKIEAIAVVLSAAIAAVSLGSVVIEPSVLKYTIVFIKGLLDGMTDTNRLLDGEEFPLFEYSELNEKVKNFISMNYRDYFRIFLLFASKEDKLERCLTVIKKDCGSELPTGIQVKTNFINKTFQIGKEFTLYEEKT